MVKMYKMHIKFMCRMENGMVKYWLFYVHLLQWLYINETRFIPWNKETGNCAMQRKNLPWNGVWSVIQTVEQRYKCAGANHPCVHILGEQFNVLPYLPAKKPCCRNGGTVARLLLNHQEVLTLWKRRIRGVAVGRNGLVSCDEERKGKGWWHGEY